MKNFLILIVFALANTGCAPAARANTAGSESAANTPAAGSETTTNTPVVGTETATNTPVVATETATNTLTSGGHNIASVATGEIVPELPTPTQANLAGATANPAQEKYVNQAEQDLAARLNIGVDQVTLNNVTALSAADLASGCVLKAGQVLMPDQSADGYQISLKAQGQDYLYHTGLNDQLILCQKMNPGKPVQVPTPGLQTTP